MKDKSTIAFLLLVTACCACDYTTIHEPQHNKPPRGELYAAALVFPDDYNWRRDPSGGEVTAELVFYHDNTEIFRKSLDKECPMKGDADMHRICGDELYSDCSTDSQTIFYRNGEELFRWDGRDMVYDMDIHEGKIYTLSSARNGSGWNLRCDGKLLLRGESGRFLSGLYRNEGCLCFDYAKPLVDNTGGVPDRIYHVTDGADSLMIVPSDVKKVLAARMEGGVFNYIAIITNYDRLIWQAGSKAIVLEEGSAGPYPDCRFIATADGMSVLARIFDRDCLWDSSGKKFFTAVGSRIFSFCGKSPQLCFGISPSGGNSDLELYYNGENTVLEHNYAMLSTSNLACDAYGFAAGLNDADDSYRPFILRGKNVLNYDFNGYFICIALP